MSKQAERHFQADAATQLRIAWITHALLYEFGLYPADVRITALVRRAVEVYTIHLEDALRGRKGDDEITRELRRRAETARVRESNQGADLGVHLGAITALPVRTLTELQQEWRAAMPKPIDTLRADLRRMKLEGVTDE